MLKDRNDRQTDAESLAVSALAYLADSPDDLSRFLALTGLTPDMVRDAAGEPGFLVGVLDYLLGDERLLMAFAEDAGVPPETIADVRRRIGDH
ncbi:DUF3572 domain-containing protein [Bauldia sp.]|uniref:DUF3572 domain-containing protein n=1 Tax=Bauldia sp. TaxID=2575872 RepID=UPI003BAB01EB